MIYVLTEDSGSEVKDAKVFRNYRGCVNIKLG